MSDQDRMIELKRQGFFCSQILMLMALDLQGRENAPLVRATHALAGGLGTRWPAASASPARPAAP